MTVVPAQARGLEYPAMMIPIDTDSVTILHTGDAVEAKDIDVE